MFNEKYDSPELTAVLEKIQPLWSEQIKVSHQFEALAPQLLATQQSVEEAKKRFALGDQSAGTELERLERALRPIQHRHDGLRATLSELDQKIRPLQAQADAIRAKLANQGREQQFEDMAQGLEKLADEILASLGVACQLLGQYKLARQAFYGEFGQRAAVVIDRLGTGKMHNPTHKLIHFSGWREVRGPAMVGPYQIVPLLPPANGNAQVATQSR
jgi:hypothetical protein